VSSDQTLVWRPTKQWVLTRDLDNATRWWFLVDGEPDLKRVSPGWDSKSSFTAVTVGDDAVGDDQAEAACRCRRFGGEKGLEHVRLEILGMPAPWFHVFNGPT